MNKTNTTQLTVKPGDAIPRGETDWARFDEMSDADVHAGAESDADAMPLGSLAKKMRRVSAVKVLRQRLGMTQAQFAAAFDIPLGTLRDWEQRRCMPDAPARALLRAIAREPETMMRLLGTAA